MTEVGERLAQAKRMAAQDQAQVVALSNARLTSILKMPIRVSALHRDDPVLVEADRAKLSAVLAKALPRRTPKIHARQSWLSSAFGWIANRPRRVAIVVLPLVVLATAWFHTPQRAAFGILTADTIVAWDVGNGAIIEQTLPAGAKLLIVAVRHNQWIARTWLERTGYVTAQLPEAAVRLDTQ
jgi:hypothetical protein